MLIAGCQGLTQLSGDKSPRVTEKKQGQRLQGSKGQLVTAMLWVTLGLLRRMRELRRPLSLRCHLVLQVCEDSDLGAVVMEMKGVGNTGSTPKVPLVPPDSLEKQPSDS